LRDKKQLPEAAAKFERAISLDPNYVNAFNNYGVVLAEQERYEDAIKRFGEALAISPQFEGALANLWQAGLTSEKMDAVLKVLLSLEQKFPDNAEFYYRAGVIYYKDNKIEEAIKQLEKAVELRPDYAEARGIFGDALVHASRYKDAAKQFETSMQLDPQNPEVLSSYALLLAGSPEREMRDLDLAISLAEEACRLTDYNDGESLDVLSQVYFGRGELESAIKTSQKAVEAANKAGEGSLAGRYKMRLEKYEQMKGVK
jgi:tetratricopeptide (TPR) repeat protein